jgi:hypothetical protein
VFLEMTDIVVLLREAMKDILEREQLEGSEALRSKFVGLADY